MSDKTQKCDVCGRAIPKKTTKGGRPRVRHRECSKALGYLSALEKELALIHYAPGAQGDAKIKRMRGRIQGQTIGPPRAKHGGVNVSSAKRSTETRDFGKR
jgi:hypothetical protein